MTTMNKSITTILALIAVCAMPAMAVPSGINYQGALTDDQGNPITGTRMMSIKLYTAATHGTLLYSEDIGEVDVSDGVFSFEFGAGGTSNAQQTDAVAITDGTATSFQKVLSAAEVVAGSVSVTDGTYTWSQSGGSSNEDDFGVAYSGSLRRVTVTYFNGAPAAGRTISATYRTPASGISGALAGDNQPWAEITVDGVAQVPRQKVLAVPFAAIAKSSDVSQTALVALSAPSVETQAANAQEAAELALVAAETAKANISVGQTSGSWSEFFTSASGHYGSVALNNLYIDGSDFKAVERVVVYQPSPVGVQNWGPVDFFPNAPVRMIQNFAASGSTSQFSPSLSVTGTIFYSDGSQQSISLVNSFGYYSNGQNRVLTATSDKPNTKVTKVTLSGRQEYALSPLITLWVNSARTVECNLPQGFFLTGYEYKILPTFAALESSATYRFQLLDGVGVASEQPSNQWFTTIDAAKLRLIVTPAPSVSSSNFTIPKGVVILKRQISN
jgi:hypothetical protein